MSGTRRLLFGAIGMLAAAVAASTASGQCEPGWAPVEGQAGLASITVSTTWDPDGDGPAAPLLVCVGAYNVAGDARVYGVAVWNGESWANLGDGPDVRRISAVTTFEGDLVVAGSTPPGTPSVYRWNGFQWSPMGSTVANQSGGYPEILTSALAVFNGELYIGGNFSTARRSSFNYLAKWNGSDWESLPSGVNGPVRAMHVYNNQLIVGGEFTQAGNVQTNYVARWNGTAWSGMGSSLYSGWTGGVSALTTHNGRLILGGRFIHANFGVVSNLCAWDGSRWFDIGRGVGPAPGALVPEVLALAIYQNDLVVGGNFRQAGTSLPVSDIARWNGSEWSTLGSGMWNNAYHTANVASLTIFDGNLIATGSFQGAGDVPAKFIAEWNGTEWGMMGDGFDGTFGKFLVHNGELIGVGNITYAGDAPSSDLVKWNGSVWRPFAPDIDDAGNIISYNGDLIVIGPFLDLAGVTVNHIARWDGAQWHALGAGIQYDQYLETDMVVHNGELIVGGSRISFSDNPPIRGIARWNGKQWLPFVPDASPYTVRVMCMGVVNNELYVGGWFSLPDEPELCRVARWAGAEWEFLGNSFEQIEPIEYVYQSGYLHQIVEYRGEIYVLGRFTRVDGEQRFSITKWTGKWADVGGGLPFFFYPNDGARRAIIRDGNLLVHGSFDFAGDIVAQNYAAWNGSYWMPFDIPDPPLRANDLIQFQGDMFFGPNTHAGIIGAPVGYARWRECCPADFNSDGAANSQDFFDFLTAFFGLEAPADFNSDGFVNSQDFFDFLTAFFEGCQ